MLFDPPKMGDSAHNFVKVVLGIDLPRAGTPAMRAASEVYDTLDEQVHELPDVMDTTRNRVRRNFGGAASDYYDRPLSAFTNEERDYVGNGARTSRTLSAELRKSAANVDYMVAMVWSQVAQFITETTLAVATAKVTFGALIQHVQIDNGDRDGADQYLLRDAHVGAVIEELVPAGSSGGFGVFVNSGFAEAFTRHLDDLRGRPDLPAPPMPEGRVAHAVGPQHVRLLTQSDRGPHRHPGPQSRHQQPR
ncbi:hypothetical protein, partial [Nocardiopsis sp. NPDC055824]